MATQRIFNFPNTIPSWYIGHMAKALKDMNLRIKETDLVIEARDARLPLSSINPIFEDLIQPPKLTNQNEPKCFPQRLIVYNKRDLADQRLEKPLREAFGKHGQHILFTNTRIDQDVKSVLRQAIEIAKSRYHPSGPSTSQSDKEKESDEPMIEAKHHPRNKSDSLSQGLKIMVCGMPNVGKSSLLNALRRVGCQKGKAASEAPMPGHTRSVGGMVKILEPSKVSNGKPVYVFDTPGIMPVFLGRGDLAAARAFKIAITAGIKDSLFDSFDLASYLLHILILRYSTPPHRLSEISKILSLRNSPDLKPISLDPSLHLPIEEFLKSIASRIKALESGGVLDLEAAAQFLLKSFRDGRFGSWTLDDLGQYDFPQLSGSGSNLMMDERSVGLDSCVIGKVEQVLDSGELRIHSPTAIKMAERRKGKEIQRAQSLSNLQKRRSKR